MNVSKVLGKKNKHKVTVYALSTCVWCKMTKEFLEKNDVEYEYVDVDLSSDEDKERIRREIQSKNGPLSYPTIIIDDQKIITGFRKDLLSDVLEL